MIKHLKLWITLTSCRLYLDNIWISICVTRWLGAGSCKNVKLNKENKWIRKKHFYQKMNKAKKRAITINKLIHFYLTWFLDILLSLFIKKNSYSLIFSYIQIYMNRPLISFMKKQFPTNIFCLYVLDKIQFAEIFRRKNQSYLLFRRSCFTNWGCCWTWKKMIKKKLGFNLKGK